MKRSARELARRPLSNLFHEGAKSRPARETWGRWRQMASYLPLMGGFFLRIFACEDSSRWKLTLKLHKIFFWNESLQCKSLAMLRDPGYWFPVFALSELRPGTLDTGCFWVSLAGNSSISQHQVTSIRHRRGKNDGLSNTRHKEIKLFMQRLG